MQFSLQDGKFIEVKIKPVFDNYMAEVADYRVAGSDEGSTGKPDSPELSDDSNATTDVAFSNYNYPIKSYEEQGDVFMKLRGKPGISKKNLFVIPGMVYMLLLTAADVMQTSSQLLSDPNSYDLGVTRAAIVNTNSMTYASIVSILALLGSGLIFDILGRRATMTIMFLIGAVSTLPFPFGKDLQHNVAFFTFFKVTYNCSAIALLMNPFINDYVKV